MSTASSRFLAAPGGGMDIVNATNGGGNTTVSTAGGAAGAGPASSITPEEKERLYNCILQLNQPETREEALQELRYFFIINRLLIY